MGDKDTNHKDTNHTLSIIAKSLAKFKNEKNENDKDIWRPNDFWKC